MNNLIIAVIAIAFSALIMTAGMNYLTPSHGVLNTEATNSTIEIDQMLTDYNNLKINLGRMPTKDDYLTVYAATFGDGTQGAETANSTYRNTAGGLVRPSFLQGISQTSASTAGWVFQQACGTDPVTHQTFDCFKMTVDNSQMAAADAQTTCQALALAQKRLAGNAMAMAMQNPDGSPHTCN